MTHGSDKPIVKAGELPKKHPNVSRASTSAVGIFPNP